MASGNLGNLFISLGIKDEMSKTLQKIVKGMNGVDQATQDAKKRGEELVASLNQINGNNFSKIFREANEYIEKNTKGIANIAKILKGSGINDTNILTGKFLGAGNLAKIASLFGTINSELQRMSKNEDDADRVKAWQNRISNALAYIKLLQDINIQEKKISNTKAENPNVDTKSLDNAKKSLNELRESIISLIHSGGVDDSNILSSLTKVLGMAKKDVQDIISTFKKDNPLSAFTGGAAKVEADIARVTEKLAKMRDLMSEGTQKGYSTSMLTGSISELDNILTRLNAAKLNPTMLTDAAQMRNLISDVLVEMTKATAATQAYGREKGKVIAQEKAAAEEYNRQRRQRDAAKKAQDEELKALSDYAKRYMELQEAKIKADKKASDERKRQSEAERKRIETDTARMSKLYATMSLAIGRGERAGIRGLELGVNTSALEKALSDATELKKRIEDANIALIGKGGRPSYSSYVEEVNRLSSSLANATQAQRDLNSAQDKANRKAEAQAIRDAAKAKREDIAVEKQRQNELKNTERRFDSLGNKVRQLRSEYSRGISIGADVSKAEDEIKRLLSLMRALRAIRDRLNSENWKDYVGALGSIGSGHDTTLASRVLQDQRAVNREVQRGVELERKRKQEVANLARAFEQAKKSAGGMSSAMQDLKSLFMQGGIVYGAQQFLMSVVQTGGELEKQHIALQSILGDMQNANTMFAQVKELALNSPFTFSELNKDVKQLAAYGVEYDQLYDTTKRLADMASGLGVSFERIALAFGQVQARGWLDGKELRQISYAGIPLLEKLSEYYSKREGRKVSTSEIKTRISSRGVDFEDVKNVFWEMTDAGGQFYNMQQVLSETLLGRYNKLKDAWEIMLSDFASGSNIVGRGLKGVINLVTELVQAMHTLAPVVAAAFSGFALRRLQTMLGGGIGTALLSGKASVAAGIQQRVLMGEKVSAQELRILQTKKQITIEDLRALAAAKALTKAELDRMLITKSITPEIYRQAMTEMGLAASTWTLRGAWNATLGMMKSIPGKIRAMAASTAAWFASLRSGTMSVSARFAGMWTSFKLHGAAAISVITAGAKALGASLWTAIGGLPGLLITGVTMGLGYWYSKNEELKNSMKQTADELQDRYKQINDFLKENDASKAIAEGDSKAIDNMIDEYKEKIKQIAPYNYNNLVMKAEERESHKERLKYLADELSLLQQSNKVSQEKLSDNGTYKELKDALMRSSETYDSIDKAAAGLMAGGADKATTRKKAFDMSLDVTTTTENLKKEIENIFGDISKDRATLEAAKLSMSNLFAQMGIPEDRANEIRASVLQAFGVTDGWLESQVGSEMRQMIDNVAPEIAMKIRSGQKLNKAETKKVKELMDDAKRNLTLKYPEFETTLQRLLAASRFTAVIDLVVNDAGKYGDVQGTMAKRMPKFSLAEKSKRDQYMNYVSTWGKQDSWYEARNSAKSEIDRLKNEYDAAKRSKASKERQNWLKYQYDNAVGAAWNLLNYDYKGEDKKSNKVPKVKGDKKDEELEELKRQLDDFKAARQYYQKLRKEAGFNKHKAKNETVGLYKDLDWKKIDLDNYLGSLERLKEGFNFDKSRERQKFRTQIDREKAEWKLSEDLKPEWERVAANFKEALEKGVKQADLEKELYEKTGDKGFASLAWKDGAVWTEQTRRMAEDFKKKFGEDVDLGMTDADAKKHFENTALAYEMWQKITTLVKDNYVKSLQQAADIMEKTATTEAKIAAVNAKYEEPIRQAEKAGNRSLAERYRQTRDKETGQIRNEAFKESTDYLAFYEAIMTMGIDKAEEVAKQIREQLNQALKDGSIDAREYAKQIAQVEEQLDKLGSGRKTLWNSGFAGRAEGRIELGKAKMNEGSIQMSEGERLIREGKIDGDTQKVLKGEGLKLAGKVLFDAGEKLYLAGKAVKKGWEDAVKTVDKIDNVAQGLNTAFNDVRETMGAMGFDTESDGWQDAAAVMGSLSGISGSISNVVKSGATGDIGGVISGAVGIFTSPFKAFAAAHDAKQERQIKLAERNITELERMRNDVKTSIENTLGGVYSYQMDKDTKAVLRKVVNSYEKGQKRDDSGMYTENKSQYSSDTYNAARKSLAEPDNAFLAEQASLMAQKDEMQRQMNAEEGKKKKDKDKIADYKQQIKEMETTINQLATDFLKDIYGVDMKSWASQLTDAVVSAWEKGEDAIDAYKKKAKEMVKDLTKNIISQKIMEVALQGPLDNLTQIIKDRGKLEPEDVVKVADDLYNGTNNAAENITAIMERLKNMGLDLSDSGDSSLTNGIKNITEETADILASYVNAIRLDVSVNRAQVKDIGELLKMRLPEMGQIQKAQLGQLTQIVMLAEARNEKLDHMIDWMTAVSTSGRKKIYIS